jgi:alanine-alpha-ketoisovalerate/valine-pyruvate aminotransferase
MCSDLLYNRCRELGLIIVPGTPFFFSNVNKFDEGKKCFRISLAVNEEIMISGVEKLKKALSSILN